EDHGICPDCHGQSQNGGNAEPRRFVQHATGVTHIVDQSLKELHCPLSVIILLDCLHRAKFQHRLAASLNRRHPFMQILFCCQSDVLFNLFPDSLFVFPHFSRVEDSDEEPPQGLHEKSSALASKNRPMMAAVCCQSWVSCCSCFR